MQVLRYSPGQRYKQHMDANGRMCTVLIYLTGPLSRHERVDKQHPTAFAVAVTCFAFPVELLKPQPRFSGSHPATGDA